MRKKNIVCIVQARTQSTRFPEKILKNIRNLSLIEILIMRLKKSKKINQLVLATTKNKSDEILEKIARKRKISFFRGPSDDVLKRYYLCAKKFDADIVVRITSDCPLIDSKLLDNMIEKFYELQNADYFTCVYYRPRGQSKRMQFKSYKEAYQFACQFTCASTNEIYYKNKIMFYAVKGTSQCHIGGLK